MPEPDSIAPHGAASAGWFATTHWSVVLAAGDDASPRGAQALNQLCQVYWRPLYTYLRRRNMPDPDACDCIQGFFADLLERSSLTRVDPARGRFRSFLLASLKNFVANERERSQAAKRGGQFAFISWEEARDAPWFTGAQSAELVPDQAFERTWALALLDHVLKRLREDYARGGREALFDALQVYMSGDKGVVPYSEMAARLELGESALKMAIQRLRRRYGELLREEIAHTVTRPEDVDDEIRALFAAIR